MRFKGYMKAVKAKLAENGASPEEITAFEKGASSYVKEKLLPKFKDFEFYTGESMDPDGLYVPTDCTRALFHCQRTTYADNYVLVLCFSTTVRTVSPPMSLPGSTASRS